MKELDANRDWLALVDGIRHDPDSDIRRLVAADWLDDHGFHERATFIRLQVEHPQDPEACELLSEYGRTGNQDWVDAERHMTAAVSGVTYLIVNGIIAEPRHLCTVNWRRGFVESVSVAMRFWCGDKCWCERHDSNSGHVGFKPDCPACGGKDYYGALGPVIVRHHPVAMLETDRVPHRFSGLPGLAWLRSASWGRRDTLPSRVYRHLKKNSTGPLSAALMPDREAWEKATSDAAIAWAVSEK